MKCAKLNNWRKLNRIKLDEVKSIRQSRVGTKSFVIMTHAKGLKVEKVEKDFHLKQK